LEEILPLEYDYSYLCQIGVWYFSIGHRQLAIMVYKRSIELHPEAATYFNLAVCFDDIGELEEAKKTVTCFYELVSSDKEKKQAEQMLYQNGKKHLIFS
jgi:tetratricopeptide (TPR) repeat protein